jgi:hypothetical protein
MPDVPTAVVFTGLACGTLLAAAGLALWDSLQQALGLSKAVRGIRWMASGLLLTGAVLAWQRDQSISTPALRLTLMAIWAALPAIHRQPYPPWGNALSILPALALAWAGLFLTPLPTENGASDLVATLVEVAVVTCGGLSARALAQGLGQFTTSIPRVRWPSATAHVLLTLLAASTGIVNLWQRGAMWGGNADERGLAGAWLAWSAARLSPRQPPWLPTVLTAVATLLLVVVAVGY